MKSDKDTAKRGFSLSGLLNKRRDSHPDGKESPVLDKNRSDSGEVLYTNGMTDIK